MRAMLCSDYLNLKQSLRTMISLPVFFLLIAFVSNSATFLGTVFVMMCLMLPINLFSYDTAYGWDKLTLALPISRTQVILSKYVLCLGTLLAMFVFLSAGGVVFCLIHPEQSLPSLIGMLLVCAAVSLLLIALTLPLIVKFGIIKGRYILMAVVLIPTLLIISLPSLMPDVSYSGLDAALTDTMLIPFGLISLAAALLLHAISAEISILIYRKKEF